MIVSTVNNFCNIDHTTSNKGYVCIGKQEEAEMHLPPMMVVPFILFMWQTLAITSVFIPHRDTALAHSDEQSVAQIME